MNNFFEIYQKEMWGSLLVGVIVAGLYAFNWPLDWSHVGMWVENYVLLGVIAMFFAIVSGASIAALYSLRFILDEARRITRLK